MRGSLNPMKKPGRCKGSLTPGLGAFAEASRFDHPHRPVFDPEAQTRRELVEGLSSAKVSFEGLWWINSAKGNEAFAEGRRVPQDDN